MTPQTTSQKTFQRTSSPFPAWLVPVSRQWASPPPFFWEHWALLPEQTSRAAHHSPGRQAVELYLKVSRTATVYARPSKIHDKCLWRFPLKKIYWMTSTKKEREFHFLNSILLYSIFWTHFNLTSGKGLEQRMLWSPWSSSVLRTRKG